MDNRQVAEAYARAIGNTDVGAFTELAHPDIVISYPQSGEVIRGKDNALAAAAAHPARYEADLAERHGVREQVYVASTFPFATPTVTVSGSGDTFIIEGVIKYDESDTYHVAMILQIRDSKVASETSYFALPFDPPDFRAPYVE